MGLKEAQLNVLNEQIEHWNGIIASNIKSLIESALRTEQNINEASNITQRSRLNKQLSEQIEQAILNKVILFTLDKIKSLIDKHQRLAPDTTITANNSLQTIELIKLLNYSYKAFQRIENLQTQLSNQADAYYKIASAAVKALIAAIVILVVGSLTLYVASTLASIALMPVVYTYIASAGALFITAALGIYTSTQASRLRNIIPGEVRSSHHDFYAQKNIPNIPSIQPEDGLAAINLYRLQKKYCITKEDLDINCLKEKSCINELWSAGKSPYINYYLDTENYKIIYRINGNQDTRTITINREEEVTQQTILNKIIDDQTMIEAPSHRLKFFQNAFAKILPQAGTEELDNPTETDAQTQILSRIINI